jgi:hypothetical protein
MLFQLQRSDGRIIKSGRDPLQGMHLETWKNEKKPQSEQAVKQPGYEWCLATHHAWHCFTSLLSFQEF